MRSSCQADPNVSAGIYNITELLEWCIMGQTIPVITLTGEDRLWIDSRGGIHSLDRSHGAAFESIHQVVYGTAVSADGWLWMQRECGSGPLRSGKGRGDWAGGDNFGWQFVRYASHVLGWARVTINAWVGKTEVAVEFDDEVVTDAALRSVISVIRHVNKNAPSEVIVTDDFGNIGRDVALALPRYLCIITSRNQTSAGMCHTNPLRRFFPLLL
jgi:hypothetical protein